MKASSPPQIQRSLSALCCRDASLLPTTSRSGTVIALGAPFVGIVYLRPGHISASFVLAVVDAVLQSPVDVEPPFILVAERREATVRVRVRTGPPW
jgi:hypothetical protein